MLIRVRWVLIIRYGCSCEIWAVILPILFWLYCADGAVAILVLGIMETTMKFIPSLRSAALALTLMGAPLSSALAAEAKDSVDPWEGFNRKVFAFNDTLDRYLLKPLAKGYKAVTPDPVEGGVSSVFSNLKEVSNIANDLLQGKFSQAGNDTGRLLVNTTLGLVGIFDVAEHMGLPKSDGEDFGQTLATWGVGSGPYVVLPFLGSSTVRSLGGMPVNTFTDPIGYVDHVPTRNSLWGTQLVELRASLLEAESLISGDKYTFMRDAYLQRRNYLAKDGDVEDDFGGDFGSDGF